MNQEQWSAVDCYLAGTLVAGGRGFIHALAAEPRVSATAMQTVGAKTAGTVSRSPSWIEAPTQISVVGESRRAPDRSSPLNDN